jgi:hypothetical protein
MHGKDIIWGDWNRAHITGHGGTQAMAETIIRDPATRWENQDERTAKGFAVVITRAWTLVVMHDDLTVYPVTMYPTTRGGRRHRRNP